MATTCLIWQVSGFELPVFTASALDYQKVASVRGEADGEPKVRDNHSVHSIEFDEPFLMYFTRCSPTPI